MRTLGNFSGGICVVNKYSRSVNFGDFSMILIALSWLHTAWNEYYVTEYIANTVTQTYVGPT